MPLRDPVLPVWSYGHIDAQRDARNSYATIPNDLDAIFKRAHEALRDSPYAIPIGETRHYLDAYKDSFINIRLDEAQHGPEPSVLCFTVCRDSSTGERRQVVLVHRKDGLPFGMNYCAFPLASVIMDSTDEWQWSGSDPFGLMMRVANS